MSRLFFRLALVAISSSVTGLVVQQSAFISTKENFKLSAGYMIKRQTTHGSLSCSQACLSAPLCAGFNYQSSSEGSGSCELYKAKGQVKLTRENGWLCGRLLDRQKTVKHPAKCESWRTKDGNCCVFPFTYQTRLYDSCLFDGQLWCSITDNYDTDRLRGVCEDFNFTFTTLGAVGPRGPTDTSGYQGTTLEHTGVKLSRGIQKWKVPLNGCYVIRAWGASGADGRLETSGSSGSKKGGMGAYMKGTFNLTRGALLKILIGQKGSKGNIGSPLPGGGGGGTFVTLSSNIPLIVAGGGGGGGAPTKDYDVGDPGQSSEMGSQHGGSNGTGGVILEEGFPSNSFEAGAGGGLNSKGESAVVVSGGDSFKHGGEGGDSMNGATGGFGGGGGGQTFPGAGGGYSGGGVFKAKLSGKTVAGGGGSYNSGETLVKIEGKNVGDGKVIITLIDPELL